MWHCYVGNGVKSWWTVIYRKICCRPIIKFKLSIIVFSCSLSFRNIGWPKVKALVFVEQLLGYLAGPRNSTLIWHDICQQREYILVHRRPTQPDHPSVGRHNEYWRWSRSPLGKKRWVLRNSGPVPGVLAYTGILVKGAGRWGRPSGWHVSYASLIGFTLAGLKA